MLIITNRKQTSNQAEQSTGKAFVSKFSVGSGNLSVANVTNVSGDLERPKWKTSQISVDATDSQIKKRVIEYAENAVANGRSILVYIHGNNNNFAKMLERCHFLSQTYEPVEVIGFSWPSEGYLPGESSELSEFDEAIGNDDGLSDEKKYKSWFSEKRGRYLQAKKNAASSAAALLRFLSLIDSVKVANPNLGAAFSIAAHSLGGELLRKTILKGNINLASFNNVIFLAPAIDAKDQQVLLEGLRPLRRVYVSYNRNDWILAASSVVDGDIKLGTNPLSAPPLSANPKVRYVDFEGAAGGAGHRYFLEGETLDMKRRSRFKAAKRLFDRIFGGRLDVQADEGERAAYLLGCSENGKICYMGSATGPSPNDSPGE